MILESAIIPLSVVLLAGLIHASFQLSISVLTLLSGHALGRKTAERRLIGLVGSYILGAIIMTVLVISFIATVLSLIFATGVPRYIWAILAGTCVGVGVSVWLFYYKKGLGTILWIPRPFAKHLDKRARQTKSSVEAFSLGLTSVFSELLFSAVLFVIAALILIYLTPELQLYGILLYATVSLLPLLIIGILISNGKKISHIQRWRENNKRFLQFAAGSGLLILGAYIYSEYVIVANVLEGLL